MPLQAGKALGKVVVQAVDRIFFGGRLGAEHGSLRDERAQLSSKLGVVADLLGDDIRCAGQRVRRGLHALVRVHVGRGQLLRRGAVGRLRKECLCQRLQPLFPGNGGAGTALGFIGTVQILQHGQCLGRVNGGGQLLRQLSLLLDGAFHGLPPLL